MLKTFAEPKRANKGLAANMIIIALMPPMLIDIPDDNQIIRIE